MSVVKTLCLLGEAIPSVDVLGWEEEDKSSSQSLSSHQETVQDGISPNERFSIQRPVTSRLSVPVRLKTSLFF